MQRFGYWTSYNAQMKAREVRNVVTFGNTVQLWNLKKKMLLQIKILV